MFIRTVKSRSSTCFQIGYKRQKRFVLVKHVGCASKEAEIEVLKIKAKEELIRVSEQLFLFPESNTPFKAKQVSWKITGYHQVFGRVYDSIGFPNNLLRDLTIARIVFPHSKLATVRFLSRCCGIKLSKDKIYRFLGQVDKEELTKIAYSYVTRKNKNIVSLVFYDVTTLYFETEREDDLRRKGFSKDHRADVPQVLVGLFVDIDGYPFDFDFFSGNTFEGDTFPVAIKRLMNKYQLKDLVVVADAGMLSIKNLGYLESIGLGYVVGARLKNLNNEIKTKVLSHNFMTKNLTQFDIANRRLIVDYSEERDKKDKHNRERIIKKLQAKIDKKQTLITKSKYLLLEKEGKVIGVDLVKIDEDKRYDGLKGYFTNLTKRVNPQIIISQYHNLWKVEKAFRMSKSDLQTRPVYHHNSDKVKAHLVLCFVSLLVMKVTERLLAKKNISLTHAIELLSTVGQGKTKIGNMIVETESEVDQKTKSLLEINKLGY